MICPCVSKSARYVMTAGLVLFLGWSLQVSTDPIRISTGLISGATTDADDVVRVYKGIPYAAPPVGELRWKAPAPPASWEGVRESIEFGPSALQRRGGNGFSEDCLYLNVWTAAEDASARRPVMVWIHGGGFTSGSGSGASYDGEAFARRGVVLVTINYRLGPLGYFAHSLLTEESGTGSSGNYGFLDQIAALRWVQENIAAFGGDPERVTIFGESAGATSIYALVASPIAKGLFHRAISESAWVTPTNIAYLKRDSFAGPSLESRGKRLAAAALGDSPGDVLAALRAIPSDEVLTRLASSPVVAVGGRFMPEHPEVIYNTGAQNNVPVIAGTNSGEGIMFSRRRPESVEAYREARQAAYGDDAEAVLAVYSVRSTEDIQRAVVEHITHIWSARPTRVMVRGMERINPRVYLYQFTRSSSALGANHAAEIRYVFNTLNADRVEDTDTELAKAMITYWSQFAATGNPNGNGLPDWPAYRRETDQHLELGDTISVKSGLHREALDVFDKLMAEALKTVGS